ncbi:peptidoglycan DD-metalloendopeptidase family protein [Siphonobacter aquaeclarae]|uniref:Murein DD-endopeptidase MepM and murein hydrolase activator NlpD, contain LysM domain n=1 Tax=Siphonobacter aquaeclarae TaxID=563176 RepID=A0A1G9RKR3_9BACT|nr:peptidoglycan DD-metalloendopeptidase family protein [Siphonobacter aquaeclarae]SDM23814.1 Murein DD-endopeptidase MepM and murein hydrolase activator NlpD, contain LysM domain [Siphonobacter aquaeclarae]
MSFFRTLFLLSGITLVAFPAIAQERGVFRKTPSIKAIRKPAPRKIVRDSVPGVRSMNEFQPLKPGSPTTRSAVDTLNDAQLETDQFVVETRQEIRPRDSESWARVSEHFRIWDEHHVNPYGYDIRNFNDLISIQLYDSTKQQYWSVPMDKNIPTSVFGWRQIRWHKGIDLDLVTGDPVRAAFDGQVRVVSYEGRGFGRYVVVRHYNGLETVYGHLSKQLVVPRQEVKAGDVIGRGGNTGRSTGSHLHFEIRYEGYPFNPLEIFAFPENYIRSDTYLLTPRVFSYITGKKFEPLTAADQQEEGDSDEEIEYRETDWYAVKKGDTLDEISRRSGISIARIKELNGLRTTRLQIGQKLRLR